MRLSGSVGKSASDLFAEFFPTGTVSLDVSQSSPPDASSAPTASSNPEPTETTAQSVPPQSSGLLAHNGSDGSPSDLDSATAGTVADVSSEHAPASATTDSDNAFYALSSDAYWSNDEGVSPRPAELGADGHNGALPSITNGSEATSAAGFAGSHFTFNDSTSAVSSNAPIHAGPSSAEAASGAPIETITAAPPALHPSEAPPALMLVGDFGSFAASSAGSGGTGSGSGSGGTLVSGGSDSSGLVINIVWDASVANAPAGFKAGVEAVVSYFESHFSDPITITIDVGYGEVDGQPLGVGALAESATVLTSVSYSALEAALVNNANAIGDTAAAANIPTTSPVSGNWWLSTAEALALGLSNVGGGPDGYIGFSNSVSFCYNDSNGVPLGQYDFFGVVAHEISEVMGRQMMDGENFAGGTSYEPLDLFHYSAPGVHDFSGTTAGYFSPDGGTTNLGNFNTNPSGDFGDWAGSVGNNSFLAFSSSGVVNPVTANDLAEMNLLGWDPTTSGGAPVVTIALADDTSGGNDITANDALTGTADPNATVTLTEGSTVLGTTTANAGGVWSFTPIGLAQGLQTITASETNAAGLTGSSSLTFTYETTPKVTIKLVDDTSGGKNITSFDALTGSADPNATVTLTEGSTVLGTTTADANGVWSFTPTNLAQGLQTITASETNAAGLTGSSSLTFTYQRTAPKVTIALADDTSGGKNITSDDALTGTADPNATVKISEGSTMLGTTTANANGVWSFTPTSLAQGLQTITASETNAAGLTGYSFLTFTYKTAPKVTIALADDTSGGNNITSDDALTGTADPNATVKISEGSTVLGTTTAHASGVWSFTPTGLVSGLQTITASETNAAGLTGSSSLTFTYQAGAAPTVTIALADDTSGGKNITADDALTGMADPSATVKISEGSTVLGTTTANANGVWSFTPTNLAPGLQTITASETNAAGLTGSSSLTFTYETAPKVTIKLLDDTSGGKNILVRRADRHG
jgi:Bacterial Ig-like domain/Bacterial Ig domain